MSRSTEKCSLLLTGPGDSSMENSNNDVVLSSHDGTAALGILDELADVYDEVYAEPPYNSGPLFSRSRFLDRTLTQAARQGFKLTVARLGDGELAGFSFGLPFGGGTWWAGNVTPPPQQIRAGTKFAVIELILRIPWRGRGLGRGLMEKLLEDRSEDYAILTSVPEASAHAMYERWGWYKVGTVQPAADAPTMDAMVCALPLS
jgi:GNAT superfamily N-acetyltransferase